MTHPNILWITTDRQRFDTLGCTGNPWVRTPHLDALAEGGACFEQAYCQSPICSPSRASFLTGRYPRTTRVNRNGQTIPADERLVSRLFADAGYLCGHVGKLHIAPGAPTVCHWSEQRIDDGYVFYQWSHHHDNREMSPYALWLDEQGQSYHAEPVYGSPYVQVGLPSELTNAAWIANQAIGFVRGSTKVGKPWFCTLGFEDPHNPFDPPREYLERYLPDLDRLPLPRYTPGELNGKPIYQRIDREGVWGGGDGFFAASKMTDHDFRLVRAAYWAQIDHIDAMVGRIIHALRDIGQYDNTLIIFHSDHGEMLGDHGINFQGPYFYPEMLRVPLLMHWPAGLPGRQRYTGLVELVDVAPTLLEAAGLPAYPGMQGRSLWPLLTGDAPAVPHRQDVYAEYYQAIPSQGCYAECGGAYATAVRTAEYAMSVCHNLDTGELYDLRADPHEVINRWDDPAYTDAKIMMLKRLCDRMAATIDPLPPVLAGY